MKKLFFTLALACTGVIASAQNISGSWNGELAAGLQKIPLVLNLAADGTCTLDSLLKESGTSYLLINWKKGQKYDNIRWKNGQKVLSLHWIIGQRYA